MNENNNNINNMNNTNNTNNLNNGSNMNNMNGAGDAGYNPNAGYMQNPQNVQGMQNASNNLNVPNTSGGSDNGGKEKTGFQEFKPYMEAFTVLLVITCCILCFLPICNGSFSQYGEIITANPDVIDEDEANRIKEQAKEEENVADSLELQREVTDVINDFIGNLKNGNYDAAYAVLASPTYSDETTSLKYDVEYNKGYAFFKTYLSSYETTVSNVTMLENAATVTLKIKRYDINRLVNSLISNKLQEGEDFEDATYEELLFEYEKYLKDEFSKSNVYTKENEYIIGLKKEDDAWKIVNDDELDSSVINLEFRLVKDIDDIPTEIVSDNDESGDNNASNTNLAGAANQPNGTSNNTNA